MKPCRCCNFYTINYNYYLSDLLTTPTTQTIGAAVAVAVIAVCGVAVGLPVRFSVLSIAAWIAQPILATCKWSVLVM